MLKINDPETLMRGEESRGLGAGLPRDSGMLAAISSEEAVTGWPCPGFHTNLTKGAGCCQCRAGAD